MKVVICEDNIPILKQIANYIKNYAFMENNSIEVVLQAARATEVLSYLEVSQADCYFLDIDLNSPITGMDLAQKIRTISPLATIIFVTTHSEMAQLTFTYRIEALDFIVKDTFTDLKSSIIEALIVAYDKYKKLGTHQEETYYTIEIGEYVKNVSMHDILYFETSNIAHKICVNTLQGHFEFYSSLHDIEETTKKFFRVHRAYVVNLLNVIEINKKKRQVILKNGFTCPVSIRRIKKLEKALRQYSVL